MSAAHNAGLRTVGVEEELLIVDRAEGRPLPLAGELLAFSRTPGGTSAAGQAARPMARAGPTASPGGRDAEPAISLERIYVCGRAVELRAGEQLLQGDGFDAGAGHVDFQGQAFHHGVCAFHDLVDAWMLCPVTWPWAVIRAKLETPDWHGWAAWKAQGGIPRGCSGTAQGA